MKNKFITLACFTFVLVFIACSDSGDDPTPSPPPPPPPIAVDEQKTFTFSSNGTSITAKIFLPAAYENDKNLPAIYLLDFPEQLNGMNPNGHVAHDEFEKVIAGIKAIKLNALVIVLNEYKTNEMILPRDLEEYTVIVESMTAYVDDHFTSNTSRTFIARGNEAGLVLNILFWGEQETSMFQNFIATDNLHMGDLGAKIERVGIPQENENKKLHFSFTYEDTGIINFINTISDLELPWLEFESVSYPNMTFENGYPKAYADGIKFMFED